MRLDACDIDAEAVRWADSNIRRGTFIVVEPYPPLPWNDATFDAVFACSVFTHLSRDAQAAWLAEMERVINPGGMLLASICSGGEADFSDEAADPALDGIAPAGYYRGAIQSRAYALAEWSAWFDIAEFIENGLESSQDLVVMRRRVESAKPPRAAEPPNYQDGSAQVDGPAHDGSCARLRLREHYPPGHFHSPIPSAEDVERAATRTSTLRGIDLRHDAQLTLFHELKRYYPELPFGRCHELRYSFDNPHYGYSDAIILYSMIRHLRPLSIIEVGSGYSSCVMLDTIELFFGGAVDCTFIDPAAELLLSLLKPGDSPRIIADRVQDVPESVFTTLGPNDILFIDSTHVLKAGSDLNHLLFEILPILSSGVFIHFHDVFHPFEYPRSWLRDLGLAWNEIYALRAFLQYNEQFEIAFSNTYLEQLHEDLFRAEMPLCLLNPGGSLWVKRR